MCESLHEVINYGEVVILHKSAEIGILKERHITTNGKRDAWIRVMLNAVNKMIRSRERSADHGVILNTPRVTPSTPTRTIILPIHASPIPNNLRELIGWTSTVRSFYVGLITYTHS